MNKSAEQTFVGAFLQLLVVAGLLNQLKDGDRQISRGEGESLGIDGIALLQATPIRIRKSL
jgi:hypothetical protein